MPPTEKVQTEQEPRFLEDEGLYVGVRPAIAKRNKNKMENRLLKQPDKVSSFLQEIVFVFSLVFLCVLLFVPPTPPLPPLCSVVFSSRSTDFKTGCSLESFSLSLTVSLSLFVCFSVSVCLSLSLSVLVSLSLSHFLCFSVSLSVCLSLSLSLSVCLFLTLILSLCLCLSLPLSLSVFLLCCCAFV